MRTLLAISAFAAASCNVFAQAVGGGVPGEPITLNTLINSIGVLLIGTVAWLIKTGITRTLARLDRMGRRLSHVERCQLVVARKMKIRLPDPPDEAEGETDEE